MRKLVATLALISGAVSFTACDSFGQAMGSHTNTVARAAGHELSVDQTVTLLTPYPAIPAKAEIISAIGNLWIDFTLLATAALEDSTLKNVDMGPELVPYFNQQLVFKLRDKVIKVDTMLSDAQLKAMFDKEQPGAEVHARHILLTLPPDATPHQRDSVMTLAKSLRDQARGGADFVALAKKYSQEPNADKSGGDLGYFTYEKMVPPFSAAAFAMKKGDISDPVETVYGLHIIKVEDRKTPDFEASKESFRQTAIAKLYADAEKGYLDKLMADKKMEVQDGAIETARELAKTPDAPMSGRAKRRTLVKYEGGELTAKDYLDVMRSRQAEQRAQVADASDDDIKDWLKMLARDEVLIDRAKEAGLTTPKAEEDSLKEQAHTALVQMSRMTGLNPIVVANGESKKDAVEKAVNAYLAKVLKGEMQVVKLGAVGYTLREKYEAEMFEKSVPAVVTKLEAKRPPAPAMPQGMQMPQPQMPAPAPATTTGGGQ
jgi:hypothetical protein